MRLFIIFLLIVFAFSSSAQNSIQMNFRSVEKDTSVKLLQYFTKKDGTSEVAIIERKRTDKTADKWLKKYVQESHQRISKNKKNIKSSDCSNMDFELGDLSNWTTLAGFNPNSNPYGYPTGTWTDTTDTNRFKIVSGGTDPYGGFPMLAPDGGNYSIKLGNDDRNAEAEQLIYSFLVTDTNFLFKYALVMQDPEHVPLNQPFLEIKILDSTNNIVFYNKFISGDSLMGFSVNSNQINYKSWNTRGCNFSSCIGQTVSIVVTNADCAEGGHFGYSYIDFMCPNNLFNKPILACNDTSYTLSIPDYDPSLDYNWSTGDTTPVININPNQYVNQQISCNVTSNGLDGFWYIFNVQNELNTSFDYTTNCLSVSFNDISSTNNSTINTWNWDFGDGSTSNLQNPVHTYTSSGNYNVTLNIFSDSCMGSATQTLNFIDSISILTNPDSIFCINSPVQLYLSNNFNTYLWNNYDTSSTIVVNESNIGTHDYSVLVTDANGCSHSDTLSLEFYNCNSLNNNYISNINLYPNPFKDKLFIENLVGSEEIQIYSSDSKLIYQYYNHDKNAVISLPGIENGIYFILIKTIGNTKSFIISKQ